MWFFHNRPILCLAAGVSWGGVGVRGRGGTGLQEATGIIKPTLTAIRLITVTANIGALVRTCVWRKGVGQVFRATGVVQRLLRAALAASGLVTALPQLLLTTRFCHRVVSGTADCRALLWTMSGFLAWGACPQLNLTQSGFVSTSCKSTLC